MTNKRILIWCTKAFKPKRNKKTGKEIIPPFQQQRDVVVCEAKCPEKRLKRCLEYQEYLKNKTKIKRTIPPKK